MYLQQFPQFYLSLHSHTSQRMIACLINLLYQPFDKYNLISIKYKLRQYQTPQFSILYLLQIAHYYVIIFPFYWWIKDEIKLIQNFFIIEHISHSMSLNQSQIVCSEMIKQIMVKGAQISRDNRTIRNHFSAYSNRQTFSITNELSMQLGTEVDIKKNKQKPEKQPNNVKKDVNCFMSMKIQKVQHLKLGDTSESKDNLSKKINPSKSPKISKRSYIQINKKIASAAKQNTHLIDLSSLAETPKSDGRKITQAMIQQKRYEEELKQKYYIDSEREAKRRKQQRRRQRQESQRLAELKQKIQGHLSNKNGKITFDSQGQILFFGADAQEKSLHKKYPPSNVRYQFQEQPDPCPKHHKLTIKQKAAQGKAFASAILRTLNMSKFSLNLTSKTCNMDQFAYMKRNDLFNNNHSRQVTTIPFLQISQGAQYVQTNTNLSVSKKKTQRTTHSETKSKFRNHSIVKFTNDLQDKIKTKTQQIGELDQGEQIQRRRIHSCRTHVRTKFDTPTTAGTHRVTPGNEKLVSQLIQ